MYIYLNGELTPSDQAKISIFDHGYLYGVGLFETFRTYGGHPFLVYNHQERLAQSCGQIGMNWKRDDRQLLEQVKRLLEVNGLEDGYFRFNVSAGPKAIGLPHDPYDQLTEALFVKELAPPVRQKQLYTLSIPRNTPEGSQRLKSHHYLNNILAKQETPLDAEGVFLTTDKKVAEGIVSNLFFIHAGELHTPSLSTGILEGITRKWVCKAAHLLKISIHQGEYDVSFAQEADEVFVTNSIQEIVPVYRWGDYVYQLQKNNITAKLKEVYDHCKYTLDHVDQLHI